MGRFISQQDLSSKLELKANTDSPELTGNPSSTTPDSSSNNTRIATTAFVKTTVDNTNVLGKLLEQPNATGSTFLSGDGVWKGVPAGPTGPKGDATYDLHNFINGKPTALEVLMRSIAVRIYTCPVNFTGSYAYCSVACTTTYVIDILKNNVAFGTITFNPSSTAAVFSSPSALTMNVGDQLALRCRNAIDATLSDITVSIFATSS